MIRAGTGSDLIQGPRHGLDRGMNLGEGRNLNRSQDGEGDGGLSRVQDSDGAVA